MESALPFGSYLTSLPADDALMASGLAGAFVIQIVFIGLVALVGALASPRREA